MPGGQRLVRLGVVGGRRGSNFSSALAHLKDRVQLTAVCDPKEEVRDRWRQNQPDLALFGDWHELLRHGVCDALLIATPMQVHAEQAIAAMRAGCDVLSEVPACLNPQEAEELIKAVERTGRLYMMAENYCYRREHMMVQRMIDAGVFGELTYAEGMYLHDCRGLKFEADGALTWRGQLAHEMPRCNYYPTHSLGPIAQWLALGRQDALESVYSLATPGLCMADYVQRRFSERHPGALVDYWRRGDGASCLLRTRKGRVIHLRTDTSSARPHHMHSHELQGTRGCYRTAAVPDEPPLVWLDAISAEANRSCGAEQADVHGGDLRRFEPLWQYADRFEHPRWRQSGDQARAAGHGGGDFFVLEDFVGAVRGEIANPIDIYDAVAWSSISWLSAESARTERAVLAPDYRRGRAGGQGARPRA